MPFDLIHYDIWISHVTRSCDHHYYLLFIDDFTNFLSTLPISYKSHLSTICFFLQFYNYTITQFQRPIKYF